MSHYIYKNIKILQHLRQFSSNLPISIYAIGCSRNFASTFDNGKPIYKNLINARRKEANKSIVVQVSSEKSFPELYDYCLQFGEIVGAYHYKIQSEDLHYILIDYNSEENLQEIFKYGCYVHNVSKIPMNSPFVWFKAKDHRKLNSITETKKIMKTINGITTVSDSHLYEVLNTGESLNDQIKILYNLNKLNDLGTRLRFLAAHQIEKSISGLFSYANVIPFGSSVNGFGEINSDLDLILKFETDFTEYRNNSNSRLVFHTKENLGNGRTQIQRQMECFGDILQLFVPGTSNVRRILQARVPIIKFHHEYLNLEIDVSMSITGAHMSELLFIFGELDHRVKPLTYCIRKWAKNTGLTNTSPGRWITNFSLTCLVIFFLQQVKNPILPPIDLLVRSALPQDTTVSEDGINCTFLRNINLLNFSTINKSDLSELLLHFFEFYSIFDFQNRAISLNEGRSIIKPDHSAIYITNPIEQTLNVSKNISLEECERLRIEIRNGAWILESEINKINGEKKNGTWGLINLFKQHHIIKPNMFFRSRMVEVKELFEDKENSDNVKRKFIKTKR